MADTHNDTKHAAWSERLIEKMLTATLREQRASRRWSVFFKLIFFIYLLFLTLSSLSLLPFSIKAGAGKPHVAVIQLKGVLLPNAPANAENFHDSLRDAFKNKLAKAIIIDINSPGGSPVQADNIYQDIMHYRKAYPEKKVYAVISDVGASAAYYVASSADSIYANRASLVGSIGVLTDGFGFVDAMKSLGIERRLFTAGNNKAMLDPFSPLAGKDIDFIQSLLSQVHNIFIDRVKAARGERLSDDADIFSGMAYLGVQAKSLGLIDGFGSVYTVSQEVIKVKRMVDYTREQSLFDRLMTTASTQARQLFPSLHNNQAPLSMVYN